MRGMRWGGKRAFGVHVCMLEIVINGARKNIAAAIRCDIDGREGPRTNRHEVVGVKWMYWNEWIECVFAFCVQPTFFFLCQESQTLKSVLWNISNIQVKLSKNKLKQLIPLKTAKAPIPA